MYAEQLFHSSFFGYIMNFETNLFIFLHKPIKDLWRIPVYSRKYSLPRFLCIIHNERIIFAHAFYAHTYCSLLKLLPSAAATAAHFCPCTKKWRQQFASQAVPLVLVPKSNSFIFYFAKITVFKNANCIHTNMKKIVRINLTSRKFFVNRTESKNSLAVFFKLSCFPFILFCVGLFFVVLNLLNMCYARRPN